MSAQVVQFTEVVRDVSGGNSKLPQSAFQKSGSLAVVDQGQGFVAGYTDDLTYRFRSESLPVIVFGDHTKAIKYIDFPFAMGADGVKVLKPTSECDTKYLYHYLRYIKIPDAGYSRHYKFLKELRVPLPSLPEQRRIAAILDKADALCAKRREAIAKLDQLQQSVFLDMFGDPTTEPRVEVVPLSAVCSRITDGTHQSPRWAEDGVPFLFQSNVKPGEISYQTKRMISLEEYQSLTSRCPIEYGDVLYTIVGSYGNAAMVRSREKFCFQRHIAHLKPNADLLPEFLEAMMNLPAVKRQADDRVTGVAQKTLTLKELRDIKVMRPPMDRQAKFRDVSNAMRACREMHMKHAESAQALFVSLQDRAFNGAL